MKPAEKNILVIRSASLVLNATLQSLKDEFPNSKITVLAPAVAEESLRAHPQVNDVIPLSDRVRRMTVFNLGLNAIRQLRERKFDMAVSLYNIDHGLGYSNIDILIALSGAPELRGYNPQGKKVCLTPGSIFKKFLLERTSLFWIALNFFATLILFLMITLGLVLEWCYRKVFNRQEDSQAEQEPEFKLSSVGTGSGKVSLPY